MTGLQAGHRVFSLSRRAQDRERVSVPPQLFALLHWPLSPLWNVSGNQLVVTSASCPVVVLFWCARLSKPFFHVRVYHFVLITLWLKVNQSVCAHEMSFVCLVTEKGIASRLSLLSSYHLDLLVRDYPTEEKESLQFLWVLAWCLLYPVTYGLHRKNIFTTTKW